MPNIQSHLFSDCKIRMKKKKKKEAIRIPSNTKVLPWNKTSIKAEMTHLTILQSSRAGRTYLGNATLFIPWGRPCWTREVRSELLGDGMHGLRGQWQAGGGTPFLPLPLLLLDSGVTSNCSPHPSLFRHTGISTTIDISIFFLVTNFKP